MSECTKATRQQVREGGERTARIGSSADTYVGLTIARLNAASAKIEHISQVCFRLPHETIGIRAQRREAA